MTWRVTVAGLCAGVAVSLPVVARGQQPPPPVVVHFDAQREGVRLYEIDPQQPRGHRINPLCDSPCERAVRPLGRTYFFDGAGAAESTHFTIPASYSDVTIHAEAPSDIMSSAGLGTIVAGALTFAGGGVLIGVGIADGENADISLDTERKMVFGGAAAICVGALGIVVGASLMHEAKPSARVEPGKPPAVSLRLGPKGPALVF